MHAYKLKSAYAILGVAKIRTTEELVIQTTSVIRYEL